MKILVVRKNSGKSRGFNLSKATALVLALTFVGGLAGHIDWVARALDENTLDAQILSEWRGEIKTHDRTLKHLKAQSEADNSAIGRQLAQMHARLLRMEALGERVTEIADLEGAEFVFDAPPAVGGPETDSPTPSIVPSFNSTIDNLALELREKEAELEVLESLLVNRQLREDVMVAGRPINWGWISSPYGQRVDPITGKVAWHSGVDFAGKAGSNVVAVASGVVVFSGKRSGYGKYIEINHGNGLVTRYAHHAQLLVSAGQIVKKGEAIAIMGSTGRSTGPHVHFEVVKNGRTQDPASYVARRKT